MKKILLILAAVFLFWQSYKLIVNINNLNVESWVASFFFAFLLNLFITGVFAFAGFALPTQKLLPENFYKIKNPVYLKKTFNGFGVEFFRKFLLSTFWKDKAQRERFFNGRSEGIENLILQSKKSEFGHLFPFLLLTVISIYYVGVDLFKLGIFTFVLNVFMNWYPIVLQRHHRMRVDKILKRKL